MVKGPEATIEAAIERWCRDRGILCAKLVDLGRRGFPDRSIFLPGGQMLFAEVKAPGGTLSYHQHAYLERLTTLGHPAIVVYSVDELAETVELLLREEGGE